MNDFTAAWGRWVLPVPALAMAVLMAACGAQQVSGTDVTVSSEGSGPGPADRWSLDEVATRCTDTYTGEEPGRVRIEGELRDANARVDIPVACIIELGPDADVTLNNVRISSQTLNLIDRHSAPGRNRVRLHRVRSTGSKRAGLLIELYDSGDRLQVKASDLTYPAGVALKVLGHRENANTGGRIALTGTNLAATGQNSSGVMVMTSEHDGRVRAVNTTVDTPGEVLMLAGDCRAVRRGQKADCSTDEVAADLRRQAEQMPY